MPRFDLMTFLKLLTDAMFTGRPSKLTEDDVRQMADKIELFEPGIKAVVRGFYEMIENGKIGND